MSLGTVGTIIVILVIYKIIKLIIESDREAKLARVKADLKLRLLERVQDPELLRDILEKDLDLSPEGLDLHKEAWDKNRARVQTEVQHCDEGWTFKTGMLSFFMGIAAIVLAFFESGSDEDALWAGGVVFVVMGWLLLGWHVYSQERKIERARSPQDLDEGRTSS